MRDLVRNYYYCFLLNNIMPLSVAVFLSFSSKKSTQDSMKTLDKTKKRPRISNKPKSVPTHSS